MKIRQMRRTRQKRGHTPIRWVWFGEGKWWNGFLIPRGVTEVVAIGPWGKRTLSAEEAAVPPQYRRAAA